MRNCALGPIVAKERCYDRGTYTSFDCWQLYPAVPGARTLPQPVLVSLHCFCRTESVSVWIHQLVPHDDPPPQVRGGFAVDVVQRHAAHEARLSSLHSLSVISITDVRMRQNKSRTLVLMKTGR